MPLIIFSLMYITGIMLSFAKYSNISGIRMSFPFRFVMFMKLGKGIIFWHTFIFQSLNIFFLIIIIILYFVLHENEMATVYNIYRWISLVLFGSVMITAVIDTAVLERNGKGSKNENN